jgi:uncharacterized circularly permuted ATP-grasp superfamily protein
VSNIFNEMQDKTGAVRGPYLRVEEWLKTLKRKDAERARQEAENRFRRQGITFAVYGDEEAAERLIPFDIIPRVFAASEWRRLSAGIEQRVRALNAFIHDHLPPPGNPAGGAHPQPMSSSRTLPSFRK